ncbi:MAG: YeeE/YedE family protein, partial [Acidobacteria bacterium]
MGPLEITGTARLLLGLATGIAFGFILQKGQALKFHKIIDALRLRDFTIWKLMFTAIGVGMVGVYGLHELGLVKLHIKETILSANILGGLIFGAGFALLGFCPGTCVA